MDTEFILRCVKAVQEAIDTHQADIESLDREIGDGDHLINITRGCAVVAAMEETLRPLPPDEVFIRIGKKLLSSIGGASGPLIASFFMAMGETLRKQGAEAITAATFAPAFAAGVAAIGQRGKAGLGEKTMLDVLIPVAQTFETLAVQGDTPALCQALRAEALKGMLGTKDMLATKGRAAFLGERAIGHIDPGSKSCQVAITAVCDTVEQAIGASTTDANAVA